MRPLTPGLYRQVCTMLWEDWDPIGINAGGPADEYDCYAANLIRLIQSGVTDAGITDVLGHLARAQMGLSRVDKQRDQAVARKLIHLVRGQRSL